jgi:hypothetical protein
MRVAAPLLAVVCSLHQRSHYLPCRRRLAEALETNTNSIDAAISTAVGKGEIIERHETADGRVSQRASTIRHRYLDPSPELLDAYLRVT